MKHVPGTANAITPDEVRNNARFSDSPAFEMAVHAVNDALMKGFDENRAVTIAVSILGPNVRFRARVESHFRQAGWTVKFQSDQRDGDYYTFEASR